MIPRNVKTFAEFIKEISKAYGKNIAIKIRPRFRAMSWTYDELYNNSLSIAQLLQKNNVKKGDKVILWAYNSNLWVASFFGIQLAGAIVVPASTQNKEDFVRKIISQTKSKVIIRSSRLPDIKKIKNIDIENISFESITDFTPVKINENDLAEIIYTSGTTGDPKGVMLTNKNILSNVKSISKVITLTKDDKVLSILPLSHMFEQTVGMIFPLYHGCQITYATSLNSISIRKNLVDDKITKIVAVPEFLKVIMKRIEIEAQNTGKEKQLDTLFRISEKVPSMRIRKIIFGPVTKKFGKLDTVASGGAPLEPDVGEKWEQMGIYVLQGYGTTETSPVISSNGYENRKLDSVGKIVDGVDVKISDQDEILVKGPNVTRGYFNNPQKTKESFINGWYKTGDAGYFDKDSHLHIKGRTKYMIVQESGENIYPEDIENELNKIPNVHDSCVVGLKRNHRTEIHAVLLGKKIKNLDKVIQDVNSKLSSYQQIQSYSLWQHDDFPRTVTRKIKKEDVLAYLEKSHPKEKFRDHTKVTVVEKLISQITGIDANKITGNKKLVGDLKLDSLNRVELVSLIEEETGIYLDESQIGPRTTVRDIKKKLENKTQKIEQYEFNEFSLSKMIVNVREWVQKIILYPFIEFFAPQKVEGLENLDELETPVMFFPNHIGGLDTSIISHAIPWKFKRKLAVATAIDATYKRFPWAVSLLTLLINIYPFARKGQIRSSLEYTGRLIDRGFSIILFPEGKISPNAELQKIKDGAGFLGVEMNVPIVPVKMTGANHVYPLGRRFPELPTKHNVTVKFGKPIYFSPDTSYIEATKTIEDAMKDL